MMASSEPSCGVCEYQHVFKPASIWCSDCDEGLCLDCSKHHGISKATRKHGTIPISEYQNLPTYITNIKQICSKHDEKYQIYCNEHECPCCSKCIVEKHTKCQYIVNLDDVVKNTKTSSAFLEIHETLNEVAENIKQIRQDKNNNLKTLLEKRKQIECEIQQVRVNINQHLDKLQENFISELHEIEKRENKKISKLLKALDEHESKVAEHQKNITHIKQYASDVQTFLALKELEIGVIEKCQFIDSLTESNMLNRVEIMSNINTSLTDIAKSVVVFGKIDIANSRVSVNIAKKKQQQAQLILPKTISVPIENLQIQLQQTICTESSYVRGCCILPDSRVVFTFPVLNKVDVVKEDGSVDFSLSVTAAYGVVYNNEDNTIAISSSWGEIGNKITTIDLKQRQPKKTFEPGGKTTGIAGTNKILLYHIRKKGIQLVDLTDQSTRDITTDNMDTTINIAISGHNLYYSFHSHHKVVCCDLQGTQQWTFKNEKVLKFPAGISADNGGNVYVVGFGTKNVVVISQDGQK
ncbi:uncharacterized protein LOC127706779 [Mytilus californianus]|uniref:uncharacterized protein LOC127706779 n=1 Tax=Mytilus californianus TaxID=6549 RepID=UPI0022484AB2|nr:uncharacterized protein LOC127706779 [Mytilus californianus]